MKSVKRLFKDFNPHTYNLTLDLDKEKLKFSGKVVINGKKTGRPSKRLTFHQKNLKVISAKVTKLGKDKKDISIDRINLHNRFDEVRLHSSELIYPGEYSVEIEFKGKISNQLNGIYPSRFKDGEKDDLIIATQFESHHAREAFVCIDEPEAKAEFDLTLITEDLSAIISNTSIINKEFKDGRVHTKFETTPKMSTYLLAFVVGNMSFLETRTKKGILIRTYAVDKLVKNTEYALEVSAKILDFYEDYFDVPYPLSKCDFIALPDFSSGAMENWGCITFRDQALLVDEHSSKSVRQYVANVIAHELTHQWFGNLVTMEWWTDLWLNESFASWMSYLGVDHLFPEWKVWTQFNNEEQTPALRLDGLNNTHPIEVPIHHPDEIRTIFDLISYEKGASVILMLENYLGHEQFKKGIREYLKNHAYKNTLTNDLWNSISKANNVDVKGIMDKWLKQPGYPIVKADLNNGEVTLTQNRFKYLVDENDHSIWPIPIKRSEHDREIFDTRTTSYKYKEGSLINKSLSGFYRTIYNEEFLNLILKDFKNLDEIERLGILRDAFAGAQAGFYSTVDVLKLLVHYEDEESLVVWEIINGVIGSIRHVLSDNELRQEIRPYLLEVTKKQLARLTWNEKEEDTYFDKLLRPMILSVASVGENQDILKKINDAFKNRDKKPIPGDYRGFIYATIARNGSEKEYKQFIKMFEETDSPEEKLQLSSAITNFKQSSIHKKVLKYIKSDKVRIQDNVYWISGSFSNKYSFDLTWEWLKENWEWLLETQGKDLSFSRMPNIVASGVADKKFLIEFEEFFKHRNGTSLARPIKQAIETITWQSDWRERDLEKVREYFKSNLK